MKMIKKIIFLFSITYCFILQSSSKEENTNNWYRTLLSKRYLGLPVSAIIGGSLAAGLKYVFDNNKFLSSFKVAEKIKHPPYVKFVGAGMIAGVGLYELLKKLTKPKKSDSDQEDIQISSPRSMRNSQVGKEKEPEENFNQAIKVTYICPGSLYSLLSSRDGLKSDTAREIENKISEGLIKQYSKNQFCFACEYARMIRFHLKEASYAAALYLMSEDRKKLFEEKFTERCSVYDLYTIDKPTTGENLWCYALPLEHSEEDEQGRKTYSLNISSQIKTENIDQYSFQLTDQDAATIFLNKREITGAAYINRKNQ
jgi:hypothetical protein